MDSSDRKYDRTASVASRLHEADVCFSKGLLKPALEAYQRVLDDFPSLSSRMVAGIRRKMEEATQAMAEKEAREAEQSPTGAEGAAAPSQATQITERASALCDLGMFEEAAAEYEDVFQLLDPQEDTLLSYVRCLLHVERPSVVSTRVVQVISGRQLSNQEQAALLTAVSREMESRNHLRQTQLLRDKARQLTTGDSGGAARGSGATSGSGERSRYELLLRNNLITREQLKSAMATAQQAGKSVEHVLMDEFKVDKQALGKSLSAYYNCPFKRFDPDTPVPVELLQKLKKTFLINDNWVPIKWSKLGIEIVVDDPGDIRKTDHIRALINMKNVVLNVGTREDIRAFIDLFYKQQEAEETVEEMPAIDNFIPDIEFQEMAEPEEHLDSIDESANQIVRLVDQLLVTAYREGVSDIHVEPSVVTGRTHIRFRRDGVCQEYLQLPNNMVKAVVSRLKIMSGLDIAERRLPQDGKIKFRRRGIPPFELRLATIPTAGGFEDAVLRVLATAGAMKLDDMGLKERNLKLLKKLVSQPYGIVLVVGPTGSGKTTTLHSALGHINTPAVKIWTAEDPIEITQGGLRQVEVAPKIGLDFARVMRSFLRADPDVIMIGEMRDLETAAIAIEASLTGHLVFSTLHTNSAPETVTRLLDMGLNPLNFSDALLGVLAQRLVRRLCSSCRTKYHPTREEFEEITLEYGQEAFESTGIEYKQDLMINKLAGCDVCAGCGYRGRMGIHELLAGTPTIKRMIKKAAPTEDMFAQAAKEGMTTLKQDAIEKVFQGHIDMNEVRRVCI